jgi:hypothetical protein
MIAMTGLEGTEMIGLSNQLVRTWLCAAFSEQLAKRVYVYTSVHTYYGYNPKSGDQYGRIGQTGPTQIGSCMATQLC